MNATLLDAQVVLAGLQPLARAELASVSVATSTASTQADALAAAVPERGCALFLAEHQTQGQGRRGRPWLSLPAQASLVMSLSRRFGAPLAAMPGLSLVAGIAVAEALPVPGIGLKWPNDLLVDGRKLGGILVNLRATSDGGCDAVVGIGINLHLPADTGIDQPWTDLARCGAAPASRNALVAAILDRLLPALALFKAQGLAPFLSRWQSLDALAGRTVRLHDGPRVHEGVLAGITDRGALRLSEGGRERVFSSGEVSLRPA